MLKNKIILLDLNYTLAEKIVVSKIFEYNVAEDKYRMDLVEMIKGNRVFLITARTDNYKEETLAKIKADTGLELERAYFKSYAKRFQKACDFKAEVVKELFKEGFKSEDFFAIESNKDTRAKYKELNITALPYKELKKE